jgi:hypothetical protein
MSNGIRAAIAAEIGEINSSSASGSGYFPRASDIRTVEVRPGCAEIDVMYVEDDYNHDKVETQYVTIPAAPVLTRLLTWAIEEDTWS